MVQESNIHAMCLEDYQNIQLFLDLAPILVKLHGGFLGSELKNDLPPKCRFSQCQHETPEIVKGKPLEPY